MTKRRPKPRIGSVRAMTFALECDGAHYEVTIRPVAGDSTSISSLSKVWRGVQAAVARAARFMVRDWRGVLKATRGYTVDWSARQVTSPLPRRGRR